jgi:hypothetical protein
MGMCGTNVFRGRGVERADCDPEKRIRLGGCGNCVGAGIVVGARMLGVGASLGGRSAAIVWVGGF